MASVTSTQRLETACQPAVGGLPRIGLDTCCVQYYISNPPVQPWADCLDPVFQAGLSGRAELYVSTVVVSELLAHAHFASRNQAGYDPELDLMTILNHHFLILDVSGDVARAAGRLRGNYVPGDKIALRTPDALIGATSIHHGHTLFVTNDAQLADALPPGNCIYLRDVALEWLAQQFPASCLAAAAPVVPKSRGRGLPTNPNGTFVELGAVRPDVTARWDRILRDCLNVAAALNEPCLFFVLQERNGRRTETREVLIWHDGLDEKARKPNAMIKHLRAHLELQYDAATGQYAAARHKRLYVFYVADHGHERSRQDQPCFNSKSDHQKSTEAWRSYLRGLGLFGDVSRFPNTQWLHCENSIVRILDGGKLAGFLDYANNVLGLEGAK